MSTEKPNITATPAKWDGMRCPGCRKPLKVGDDVEMTTSGIYHRECFKGGSA